MLIGKQLLGYKCSEVDQYRENLAHDQQEQLAELDARLDMCRSQIQRLMSQIERAITDIDDYSKRDRSIANQVWEQVRALEEVRYQTGLQVKEAVNLTSDKVERLEEFYRLLDRIRSRIGGLSGELAEAGRFGSSGPAYAEASDHIEERGTHVEV